MVHWMRGVANSLSPTGLVQHSARPGVAVHAASKMIRVLFLSRIVSDSRRLSAVIGHYVAVAFPSLSGYFEKSVQLNRDVIPSAGTISRARVILDAAYTLYEHRNNGPA
eukprot:7905342-Pyramimonas_sp.AAC.1